MRSSESVAADSQPLLTAEQLAYKSPAFTLASLRQMQGY
jgi:hypothetical protein